MPVVNDFQSSSRQLIQQSIQDGVVTQYVPSLGKNTWTDQRIGSSVPDWRGKIRRGENATSSYNCSFEEWKPVQCSAFGRVTQKSGSYLIRQFDGTAPGFWSFAPPNPLTMDSTYAYNIARQEFIKKYRGKRTQFQSGVFLGELAETVAMIRHPAQALRQGIDSYYRSVKKRLRRSKPRNRKRVIQDTWLEYVFGWSPLVSDIQDACKLATAAPMAAFQHIKGQGSDGGKVNFIRDFFAYGQTRMLFSHLLEAEIIVQVKGAVSAENSPGSFPEQLGLSWSNVLPTVWELIPYSFLVDYFTNVGKVIDGVSTGTIKLAWGCEMSSRKGKTTIVDVRLDQAFLDSFKPVGGTTSGYATGGGVASTRTNLTRIAANSVTYGLSDAMFKLPGSGTKWLNIGALARLRR